MKVLVGIIALIMLLTLAIYSAINLLVAPTWMLCMMAYSTFFIYMVLKDMTTKKEVAS